MAMTPKDDTAGRPGDLTGVVVAFDIDNTLLDPDGTAYERTVSEFLGRVDLGLDEVERVRAYEELRAQGDVLELLGLRNPIHERGNSDALAALCVTRCRDAALLSDLGIDATGQAGHNALLAELAAVHKATQRGSCEARLEAAIAFRKLCATDTRVRDFRAALGPVGLHPRIVEWAKDYRAIEEQHPLGDFDPLMRSIASRGGSPMVISQGRYTLQVDKLRRLGLAELLSGRALVTDAAAEIPGVDALHTAIRDLIDAEAQSAGGPDDKDLFFLWYYHCLMDSWATKSPAFFARCLHAIRQTPDAPESALRHPSFVSADLWRTDPLYFVMVGDRYDQDVEPLIDLLGPDVGLEIRLRCGKYGHLHPEEELPPHRRPDTTFTDWDSLTTFLTHDLSREQINPITTPPDIVSRADLRPAYIERGLESPYEAVRTVAMLVTEMMR